METHTAFPFCAIPAQSTSHKNPTRLRRYKRLFKPFNGFQYDTLIISGFPKKATWISKLPSARKRKGVFLWNITECFQNVTTSWAGFSQGLRERMFITGPLPL